MCKESETSTISNHNEKNSDFFSPFQFSNYKLLSVLYWLAYMVITG